ncbi:MAG TPA: F0F1 ATP synthase subunit A [Patescibacteria group bacterium]|jgi:F-type H+-transporting ATPase subunit a
MAAELHTPPLGPEHLFEVAGIPITNGILGTWVAMALLILFLLVATRKLRAVPKGSQNMLEMIVEQLTGIVNTVMEDEDKTRKYLPLILTIFLFVLFLNWAALLPGFGTILFDTGHGHEASLLRAGSTDLNLTFAMAGVAFLVVQATGLVVVGIFKYLSKFVHVHSAFHRPFKIRNVLMTIPNFLLGLTELISEVAKFIALSFRLYGNIYAGEVLLVVFGTLLPVFVPLSGPFYLLEVFVGLIQAFVFAMLTIVFIKIASLNTEH